MVQNSINSCGVFLDSTSIVALFLCATVAPYISVNHSLWCWIVNTGLKISALSRQQTSWKQNLILFILILPTWSTVADPTANPQHVCWITIFKHNTIKWFQFVDDMILHTDYLKEFTKKLLELTNELCKVAGCKINTQKSIVCI